MRSLLEKTLSVAILAGKEILDVYNEEFDVEIKGDGSPLTVADKRAHELIQTQLKAIDRDTPILSEESSGEVFAERMAWRRFWLVDPLDGTKEFVKRNGEFTVNIALIDDGKPVLGVVHTPVKGISHYAALGVGAFKCKTGQQEKPIRVKMFNKKLATMVASRSHSGPEVEGYQRKLAAKVDRVDITSMGSSLKICLVAEGSADIYPRLGPTSEWDTAAAHCVLSMAGGELTDLKGNALKYNKPDILNPWFLAGGDPSIDWTQFLNRVE